MENFCAYCTKNTHKKQKNNEFFVQIAQRKFEF